MKIVKQVFYRQCSVEIKFLSVIIPIMKSVITTFTTKRYMKTKTMFVVHHACITNAYVSPICTACKALKQLLVNHNISKHFSSSRKRHTYLHFSWHIDMNCLYLYTLDYFRDLVVLEFAIAKTAADQSYARTL